jgi:N-acyl-D-amino-acid deacylase
MKTPSPWLGLLAALALSLASACGGGDSTPTDPAPPPPPPPPTVPVATVELSASGTWLLTGDTLTVAVRLLGPQGQVLGGRSVAFSSSDATLASVSTGGRVEVLGPGVVTITATAEGESGSLLLNLRPGGGTRIPALARVDSLALAFLESRELPGLSIGITRNERLISVRGYGHADLEAQEVMGANHMFRVASLSKPLTAVAILKLVEEGRLGLDDRVFEILDQLSPPPGGTPDPRLGDIRVRHLLQHTGGWDRAISGDWTYPPYVQQAASALGVAPPPSAEEVLRWVMGRPLDFDPGARFAYSNIGYSLMARIVERVDGRAFETFARDEILLPVGATRMRLGRTFLEDRLEGEVRYHGTRMIQSIFPGRGMVEQAYGWFSMEARDGQGAWVASTADYLRFLHGVDGRPHRPDVLSSGTLGWINTRPEDPVWTQSAWWYNGWYVQPQANGLTWSHGGGLPGTATVFFSRADGISYVIFVNGEGTNSTELGALLGATLTSIQNWPDHDLFPQHL